ncbi:MAG: DUF3108 domain-containing protein [Anaeromyxobacter sp.]|nr:DUF3108 domain-containing protein [Anaeromyxobacter sp.]
MHLAPLALSLAALAGAATPGAPPAPPCALPPLAGPAPFGPGEVLAMDLGLLGAVRVGEVKFSVERALSGGQVLPLAARARNTARFGPLQRLVAVGLSWIDARTLRPERYHEESDEDGRRRVSDTRLRPAAPEVTMTFSDGGQAGRASYARQGEALDALSALYLLRAARLVAGERFCFDMVGNGKYWRVEGTVGAPEVVEVPAGKFRAWRLEARARRADGQGKDRPLYLWLSDDARRLPVAAVSEVDLGPVSAKLVEARGTRRP